MSSYRKVKKHIAFVGDRHCGKTALAVRLSSDLFLDYYRPTQLVDDFTVEVDTGKRHVELTLLDLSGEYENAGVRSLAYEKCDAVVICFDLTSSASLESVTNKWLPELEEARLSVPLVLAGCKLDETHVAEDIGSQLAPVRDIARSLLVNRRAEAYIECSSKLTDGVEELTELMVEMVQKQSTAQRLAATIKNSPLLKRFSHLKLKKSTT